MKIKKGDTVIITKGKDRGKTGKVASTYPKKNKVIVYGLNQVKKNVRPKKQGEKGQIISIPQPLPVSNVMITCPLCNKPSRIGFSISADKKNRICKKCKGVL